ncbi:MAG TPA: CHRD domain-containing protein [Pyrinomonadaceae bacterium]|nr:CHRD domain-containing protein [Pyrinomonadaceae bacterium]
MKRLLLFVSITAVAGTSVFAVTQGFKKISEFLIGYEEVPAISTIASGEFKASISKDESQIDYELSYADLEGVVQQAHIHVGQKSVSGGISVWLCSNLASPPTPPGTQPCPAPPATITGTITAANVVGPTAQGVAPGEFAELISAIRAGSTYVNVHSSKFPTGEIRSQINPNQGSHNGEHK